MSYIEKCVLLTGGLEVSFSIHSWRAFKHVELSLSAGEFLNFLIFPKISGLCQKLTQAQNLLEKLGEVYMSNFLTEMWDLKRCIKAETAEIRCHKISERI